MRIPLVLLGAALLAPAASAAELEVPVYLHEYSGGLHLVPEEFRAEVGDTLTFVVTNQGASPHNFLVCGDGANPFEKCDERWGFTSMIPPNGTATTTVEVTKAGTFDYYCYVPGHKGGGMTGTLIVQGAEKKSVPALLLPGVAVAFALALALRRRSA